MDRRTTGARGHPRRAGHHPLAAAGVDIDIRFVGGHRVNAGDGSPLYHFGARYYRPNIGRWTQRDPLDQPGDLRQANPYLYAGADPVNFADASGLLFDHWFDDDELLDAVWDCANPVSKESLAGAGAGYAAGFGMGTAAAGDEGPVGQAFMGHISGMAGAAVGYQVGGAYGCAKASFDDYFS